MTLSEDLQNEAQALRRLAVRLVDDRQLADDVVQEAWLRALQQPPGRVRSAGAWMRRVVRGVAVDTVRARVRRARVERPLAGLPEDAAAARDAETGLSLQAGVLEAVRSLSEPYRSAIWQRYFEDRPPREIAARCGVPVKTVKTRLHRGLAMLRERLDASHGGDRAGWAAPLLSFAVSDSAFAGAATTAATTLLGTLLMKTSLLRTGAVVAVAAVTLWVGWSLTRETSPDPDPDARMPLVTRSADSVASDPDAAPDGAASASAMKEVDGSGTSPRRDVPASVAAGAGAVRLRVLWSDRTPAAEIGIALRAASPGLPKVVLDRRRTGSDGWVVFDSLRPGAFTLITDRGQQREVAVVAASAAVETELVLDRGVDVVGEVVRATGSPAAGASIWLQTRDRGWAGGQVVGRADSQGRFLVRAVPPTLSLGARAGAGGSSSRSELVDLDLVEETDHRAEVQLVLGPIGGRLVVSLRSAMDGAPLHGARVVLGERSTRDGFAGERSYEHWGPWAGRSDAEGRCVFEGLAAGRHEIAVQAAGHGVRRSTVQVEAAATVECALELAPAATVSGVVTDPRGVPLPGIMVRAYDRRPGMDFVQGGQIDFDRSFGHVGTLTDTTGGYHLEGVTPGEVHLLIQAALPDGGAPAGRGRAYGHRIVPLLPAQQFTWDPVLSDGRVIEGRALYRDGHPLAAAFITLRASEGRTSTTLVTDRNGRFRFVCLTEPRYDLSVQVLDKPADAPPVQLVGAVPDQGPVEIRAAFDRPSEQARASVLGRVVDAGERLTNPQAANVLMLSEGPSFWTADLQPDGRFEFPDVVPGILRLVVQDGETAVYFGEPFEVQPAERHDLGSVVTEPGGAAVRMVVARGEDAAELEPSITLQRGARWRTATVRMNRAAERVVGNLDPGHYTWRMFAPGGVSQSGELTLRAGETVTLATRLVAGAACRFEIRVDSAAELGDVTLVYELDGREFARQVYRPGSAVDLARYFVGRTLPPGRWRAVMTTATGLRGTAEFVISSVADELAPVLDLR